jgi:hypothetical protein
MPAGMPGAYSDWSFNLTQDAVDAFNEATQGLIGVNYDPFAFAEQVVAGTNYSFLVKASPVVPNPPLGVVKVHVFAPLPGQGTAQIVGNIEDIDP